MSHLASAVAPIVAAMQKHPFLMELWRRDKVVLFGDRISMTHIFWTISGTDERWVDYVGPGLYECWFSERGRSQRLWRTNSVDGLMTALAQSSSAAFANDLAPGCPYHRPPAGIRFATPDRDRTIVSWGDPDDEQWIEFAASLAEGLEFARLLAAPKPSVRLRAQIAMSRGGGYSARGRCGPQPPWEIDATRWREWLAANPLCTWEGARPVP